MNAPPRPLTLDVGPVFSLSFWGFVGAVTAGVVLTGLMATAIVGAIARGRLGTIPLAGLTVLLAQTVGILAVRPWKPRHLGRWPMAWLGGRGVSVLGLVVFSALIYSAFRPDPLVFGLVAAVSYFASLLAEVWAYTAQSKARIAGSRSVS
jgi:hypothetical protein